MSTDSKTEEVGVLEELDVEAFAREHPSKCKPVARFYVIRVDRERFRVQESSLTGREILALARKSPATHKLFQKVRGGPPVVVEPDESVSFKTPGVERFQTIPLDTTEGTGDG